MFIQTFQTLSGNGAAAEEILNSYFSVLFAKLVENFLVHLYLYLAVESAGKHIADDFVGYVEFQRMSITFLLGHKETPSFVPGLGL